MGDLYNDLYNDLNDDLYDIVELRNRYYRDISSNKKINYKQVEEFEELFDDLDCYIRQNDIVNSLKLLVEIFYAADDHDLIPRRGAGTQYPGYHPTMRLLIKYELIDEDY